MTLAHLGTDFRDTPLASLEEYEKAAPRIKRALETADSPINSAVILATCNRFEIYFEANSYHSGSDFIIETIEQETSQTAEQIKQTLRGLTSAKVARHLFSVSAGLESMIIGEEEIAGQVKRAFAKAKPESKALNLLFQSAAKTAKAVTTETGLGASGRSIITTALNLAQQESPIQKALLIGTGAYSKVIYAELTRRNIHDISVYSKSARTTDFIKTHPAKAIHKDQLEQAIEAADLIVSASGTEHFAITYPIAVKATQTKTKKTIFIDVALSKDIEPTIAQLENVELIDLEFIKHRAPIQHTATIEAAKAIIEDAVKNFEVELKSQDLDPVVTALRSHVKETAQREIENIKRKYGEETAQDLAKSLLRVANSVLHQPSLKAKTENQEDYLKAVQLLFDIEVDAK